MPPAITTHRSSVFRTNATTSTYRQTRLPSPAKGTTTMTRTSSTTRAAAGSGVHAVRRRGPTASPLSSLPKRASQLGGPSPSPSLTPMKRFSAITDDVEVDDEPKTASQNCSPSTSLSTPALLPPVPVTRSESMYTVVFDLDETLVANRNPASPAILRPHCRDLLSALRGHAEVVMWTASIESVGKPVLYQLDPDGTHIQHAIYRHPSWFSENNFFSKDLRLLGRDINRTVIIENTPQCVRLNREHGVIVPNYFGTRPDDTALIFIRALLLELIQSNMSVPEFLSAHPGLVRTNEAGQTIGAHINLGNNNHRSNSTHNGGVGTGGFVHSRRALTKSDPSPMTISALRNGISPSTNPSTATPFYYRLRP
eukprot:PhM_4_TR5927/c0_g1_i1/m.71599/K17616/CTDSPL2; CTD small phosphatase-like protein 2